MTELYVPRVHHRVARRVLLAGLPAILLLAGLQTPARAVARAAAAAPAPAAAPAAVTAAAKWTALGDAPNTGRPAYQTIENYSGYSGWANLSSPVLAKLHPGQVGLDTIQGSEDGKLYVFKPDGTRETGNWPHMLDAPDRQAGPILSSPAVGVIDGSGTPSIVVGDDNGWVFAFDPQGNIKPGWPQYTGNNAAANCAAEACTGVVGGITLADLNGDGQMEVIAGSYSHKLWVWSGNGAVLPGWPRDVWDGIAAAAAVGDINGDGSPEIIVGSDVANECGNCQPYGHLMPGGLLHVFRTDGTEKWWTQTDSFMRSAPALADLDGNGQLEIITGGGYFTSGNATRGHHVYVWNPDGSVRWTYNTSGVVVAAVAVGDVVGDGHLEIVAADSSWSDSGRSGGGGNIYVLNRDGTLRWQDNGVTATAPNGSGAYFGSPVLADVTGDGIADVVAADANWHLKAWSTSGTNHSLVMDDGTAFSIWNAPAVGDISGNGKNEVVVASAAYNGPNGPTIDEKAGNLKLWDFATNGISGTANAGMPWPQYQSRVHSHTGTWHYWQYSPPPTQAADSPYVFSGGSWALRPSYSNAAGNDYSFAFGGPGDIPVTGDWDGNGSVTIGVFRPSTGTWYLRNTNGTGGADIVLHYGGPGDVPVVGDWNNSGKDTIGVFRAGTWYLTSSMTAYPQADRVFGFGQGGDKPVVGHWNGHGPDTPGIFRNGGWYLTSQFGGGAQIVFGFGQGGDVPVIGDWNRDLTDTIGVFRSGTWYQSDTFGGPAGGAFTMGGGGQIPGIWR